jgi:hypothetical protein
MKLVITIDLTYVRQEGFTHPEVESAIQANIGDSWPFFTEGASADIEFEGEVIGEWEVTDA